jgi:hypothetical protein
MGSSIKALIKIFRSPLTLKAGRLIGALAPLEEKNSPYPITSLEKGTQACPEEVGSGEVKNVSKELKDTYFYNL